MFKVTFSEPATGSVAPTTQTVEVEGDNFSINEARNQLFVRNGEEIIAAFSTWYSIFPVSVTTQQ